MARLCEFCSLYFKASFFLFSEMTFFNSIGKDYGMVPIVYEDYGGATGNSYIAVAVAMKNNSGLNLGNLKGKKSCHTGYQKTAGYNVPVGYLLQSKKMKRVACGDSGTVQSVSKFFSKSCIPGKINLSTSLILNSEKGPVPGIIKGRGGEYYSQLFKAGMLVRKFEG